MGVNGVFGTRMKDVMERCGATVHAVEAPWGEVISLEQLQAALDQHPKVKLVGIVHAETSTGAHQPLEGFADAVHEQRRAARRGCRDQPGRPRIARG